MTKERIIKILDKDVVMRYCVASETGYEQLSGKSSSVFIPEIDSITHKVVKQAEATTIDYLYLAIASVIAAYSYKRQKPPVTAEQILYEASPNEVLSLIKNVGELRNELYEIPSVIQEEKDNNSEGQKNA